MAKKSDETMANEELSGATPSEILTDGLPMAGAVDDTVYEGADGNAAISDFNLGSDVKIDPVAPQGKYHAVIKDAKVDLKNAMIVINLELTDNGGVLSDGESALDGYEVRHRLFLPKPEDRNTPTKNGKGTKWQWKINNMAKFFNAIEVTLPTLSDIESACENGDLAGIELWVELTVDEYNGEFQNNVKKVIKI